MGGKGREFLLNAVFEYVEIARLEVGDKVVLAVRHHHRHQNLLHLNLDGRSLRAGRWLLTNGNSGESKAGERYTKVSGRLDK